MGTTIVATDLLIGGLVHRVPWSHDEISEILGSHYLGFVAPLTEYVPDVTIRLSSNLATSPNERFHDAADVLDWSGPFGAVRLDFARSDCALLCLNPQHTYWIFRFITGALLSRHAGLLLHGAALVFNGSGHLYLGPSGAGKSTLARAVALRKGTVLADDTVMVRLVDGQPVLYGAPYTAEVKWIGCAASAPLRSIHLLDRTAPLGQVLLSPSRATSVLVRSLFLKVVSDPLRSNFLETAKRLAESTPIDRLSYRLDNIPWPPP
ncbi:MAG: hypothetical protein HYY84_17505 [Deltaproteobacteria bacterium]|nr:hypothetical protein [Deltaproteobacteria bacterium]